METTCSNGQGGENDKIVANTHKIVAQFIYADSISAVFEKLV